MLIERGSLIITVSPCLVLTLSALTIGYVCSTFKELICTTSHVTSLNLWESAFWKEIMKNSVFETKKDFLNSNCLRNKSNMLTVDWRGRGRKIRWSQTSGCWLVNEILGSPQWFYIAVENKRWHQQLIRHSKTCLYVDVIKMFITLFTKN